MCSCFRPIIDRSSLAEKTELRLGEISFDKWRHIEAMSCLNWRSRDVSGWWRWTMQMRRITDSKVIIKFLCLIYFLFSLCFGKCRSFARWILTHKAYYNGQLDSIILPDFRTMQYVCDFTTSRQCQGMYRNLLCRVSVGSKKYVAYLRTPRIQRLLTWSSLKTYIPWFAWLWIRLSLPRTQLTWQHLHC